MGVKDIYVTKVFISEAVVASGNSTSSAIDLGNQATDGYFSLQVTLTGDGTAKFEYLLSNNGADYLEPSTAVDIATGHVKTSGPGSDGKDIYWFEPEQARWMKIKVTETGTASAITVSAWLAVS